MELIHTQPFKIVAIQGSVRPDNYTAKTLAVIEKAAQSVPNLDFQIIDPAELSLPLPGQATNDDVKVLRNTVSEADGVILATPEYHGSYSSVMKLIIDNLGFPSALKDKPITLLGVAAGRIGAIKALEHLRSAASHIGALVLPQVVSVPNVRNQFDDNGRMLNAELRTFVEGVLRDLVDYISIHYRPSMGVCTLNCN